MSAGPVAATARSPLAAAWRRLDLILPVALVLSVLVILAPLPAALMDILLSCNITLSVILLLTAIYIRTPLEMDVFPSVLLATTLGRLVLNVATTRLVLTRAQTDGMTAAGQVIRSFGEFVAGDTIVVGVILFVIILVIQFVVITKGATRISEVAARFALDGMPGKQMAIDADLQAKAIDEAEAQRRRKELARWADFFSAMDGASKFVRGDAIAALVITIVNIVGGLLIGTLQAGMSLTEAGALYTKLTIGDGLVSQVPALLVSLAAGLLVTRSTTDMNLPTEFVRQLFSRPQALLVAAGFLGILVFTSMPKVPLLAIGAACVGLAVTLNRRAKTQRQQQEKVVAAERAKAAARPDERIEEFLLVDPMEIVLGLGLVRLAAPRPGNDFLERVTRVRQQVAADIGIVMPKVRIRDDFRLEQDKYVIKINDVAVAEGTLLPGRLLALSSGTTMGKVPGIETVDPAFGQPAVWVEPGQRDQAEMLGYTVVEAVTVLTTHLSEVVRSHADELLTRDATRHLMDELKKSSPAVVEELVPKHLSLADVQQILQMLLREGVPVRQLGTILEALGDHASRGGKDPVFLVEQARHRLSRVLCSRYRDADKKLYVVTLDPLLEERIRAAAEFTEKGLFIRMSPQAVQTTCERIAKELEKLASRGRPNVLLVGPHIRPAVWQLAARRIRKLVVLSYNEITRDTQIESVGLVTDEGGK
ncbi:MAG: flagellar biosynthesis protein FlhA [Planctomycetia bacterium]|nr:flagellar biosynthesis protein FlhA [Planctomycetia bacterium]